jgi:hypothetical protein
MTHDMSRSRMSHNTSVGDLFQILVLHFINKSVGGSKLQLTFNCKLENGTIVEMRQEIYNLLQYLKFVGDRSVSFVDG